MHNDKEVKYDENYFLHGKETGVSLYSDYRWLPDLTRPMVRSIADHLRTGYKSTILDFGCARGYTVRAFREMGYKAWGVDISEWAIKNCDPMVGEYVRLDDGSPATLPKEFDWIIAKDVLEHISHVERVVDELMSGAKRGVFIVVPLSDGVKYAIEDYEKDVTHVQRLTLPQWAEMFIKVGWSVEARYRLKGVKDNYAQFPYGNGFITVRRLE